MKISVRSGLAVIAAATVCMVGAPGSAHAAVPSATTVTAQALPSYETWIADVTAVAGVASAYLDTRLPNAAIRPAIVLDIDNTSLETAYNPGITSPAVDPILDLARQAEADGAAVFFVTARPEILGWQTEINLDSVGYSWEKIYLRPWFNTQANDVLKTAARTAIEGLGYRIVANIGNSATDLSGGHADRTFKLPDYDGQLD